MPYAIEVKEGQEYWLCTCGKSGTGLCDGSHPEGKAPSQFVAAQDETIYVCGCGKTATSPFCDGAHSA